VATQPLYFVDNWSGIKRRYIYGSPLDWLMEQVYLPELVC